MFAGLICDAGLVPGGIDAALLRCSTLLPGQKAQVCLLALGLLADLRSRERAGRADMRVLPCPPGSPLAAVCTAGTPATDLQLFRCPRMSMHMVVRGSPLLSVL